MPDETDAELDALLAEDASLATPPVEPQTPAPTGIKAGGREFKSPDELAKAYGSLLKDYSRKENDSKRAKGWFEFEENLKAHPELKDAILKSVDEYNARRNAGQSKATAQAATGVNDAIASKVERMEAAFEDIKLERELTALKSKYNLSDEDQRGLLEAAAEITEKHGNVPLEMVYRHWAFDKQVATSKTSGEQSAQAAAAKKRAAMVGSSETAGVTPTAKKPSQMTGSEYNDAILSELAKFGYSD